jgi:cytoskeleton protein RodZ
MGTIGVWLRQTREAKGSTLEDAEAATRIRPRFLEALEAGNFAVFPGGQVQVRGFLRIYARYLGLSSEEVLARYDTEVRGIGAVTPSGASGEAQPAPSARPATGPAAYQPRSVHAPTARLRRMSLERLMVVALVLIALLTVVAGMGYFMSRNAGEPAATTATVTAPSGAALPPTVAGTLTSPIVTPTFPANSQGGVTLTLEATEHVWTRVNRDGQAAFEGLMASGQVETWSGQELIIVETGNGAGLMVNVNGQPQGTMCGRTQVCIRAWGPMGEVAVP